MFSTCLHQHPPHFFSYVILTSWLYQKFIKFPKYKSLSACIIVKTLGHEKYLLVGYLKVFSMCSIQLSSKFEIIRAVTDCHFVYSHLSLIWGKCLLFTGTWRSAYSWYVPGQILRLSSKKHFWIQNPECSENAEIGIAGWCGWVSKDL